MTQGVPQAKPHSGCPTCNNTYACMNFYGTKREGRQKLLAENSLLNGVHKDIVSLCMYTLRPKSSEKIRVNSILIPY